MSFFATVDKLVEQSKAEYAETKAALWALGYRLKVTSGGGLAGAPPARRLEAGVPRHHRRRAGGDGQAGSLS